VKKHTKVYLDEMNYDVTDFIPCEICMSKAVDIHHINARGMGGTKTADTIDNLMAVCRKCHNVFGDRKDLKDWLNKVHQEFKQRRNLGK
jgi:5-methylcytosine-specific restriction endonuclease McrA